MTQRCPHCDQTLPSPKPKGRVCFDCRLSISRHDKWHWDERQGVLTCVHRHCDNPEGYYPKGAEPVSPAPLFEQVEA